VSSRSPPSIRSGSDYHLINGKVDLIRLALLFRDVSRRGPIIQIRNNRLIVEGDDNRIMKYDSSGVILRTFNTISISRIAVNGIIKNTVLEFLKKKNAGIL